MSARMRQDMDDVVRSVDLIRKTASELANVTTDFLEEQRGEDDVPLEPDQVAALTQTVRDYARFDRLHSAQIAVLRDLKSSLSRGPGEVSLQDQFEEKMAGKKAAFTDQQINTHEWVIAAEGTANVMEDPDADLMMTQVEEGVVCPFTTIEFVEPMINSCSHSYEKKTVMSMLQKNKKLACPIPGCSATISKSSLKPNTKLQKKMARSKRKGRDEEEQEHETI
eukprot:m.48563 g.48563  ORF g.48563 m.48563 type:complete len:223 (+) comp12010_c0_seq1:205-873(+)